MGTSAVVRLGHGRRFTGFYFLLCVPISDWCPKFASLLWTRTWEACSLFRSRSSQLLTGHWPLATDNCTYAESHSLHHPLHAAARGDHSPLRPQGEQNRDPLDRQHLRPRRPPELVAARTYVLGPALRRPGLQVHRRRPQQLDPVHRCRLLPRHRRHFLPADYAHHAARLDLDPLLLGRHREPCEGILRLVPRPPDRHARRLHGARLLPLLRFLGSHARPHVPAHRHLGRPAQTLCRDQVLPLHARRLGLDAAWCPVPLLQPSQHHRQLHLRDSRALPDRAADLHQPGLRTHLRNPLVPLFLFRVPHQGPDVPVPYLAARRPRGSTHRGLRHSGRRPAEDGNVRLHPLFPAVLPVRCHEPQGPRLDDLPFHRRHRLRRPRVPHAEGHEEAGRLLLGQPPRLLHSGNLRA